MTRLAYLVTHPIQYQAPLLRRIAADPTIDLHVLFESDLSVRTYQDKGFGVAVQWDVPLLEGYSYEFLAQEDDPGKKNDDTKKNLGSLLTRERFDVVWTHGYASKASLKALFLARMRGIPSLVRSENQRFGVVRGRFGTAKESAVRQILKLPSAFLTIGTLNAAYYRELGVPDEKMFSVPYAVDNARFHQQALDAAPNRESLRQELGLQPGRPIILFASKFLRRKRAIDLLRAYQSMASRTPSRKPYLLFVGDGEQRGELENAINDPESIRVLGFKNQTEMPRYLDLCDVFVLPSDAEQWGLAVNEAMCAAKPIIVTNEVGCHADLIRPGENGYVYPVGDVGELARCLEKVVGPDDLASEMGRRSWEIVRDWDFEADLRGLKQAIEFVRR